MMALNLRICHKANWDHYGGYPFSYDLNEEHENKEHVDAIEKHVAYNATKSFDGRRIPYRNGQVSAFLLRIRTAFFVGIGSAPSMLSDWLSGTVNEASGTIMTW